MGRQYKSEEKRRHLPSLDTMRNYADNGKVHRQGPFAYYIEQVSHVGVGG